jgi:hypothetical protein
MFTNMASTEMSKQYSSTRYAPVLKTDNWMVFEMQLNSYLEDDARALTRPRPVLVTETD